MPPQQLEHIDPLPPPIYEPPDVFNPNLHPPPGQPDVLNVVEAGVDFVPTLNPDYHSEFYKKPSFAKAPILPVGKGIRSNHKSDDSRCTGDVDSWCTREEGNKCLMYGHNDGRTGLIMSSYSGWLTMYIPDLKLGNIVVKYESWHWHEEAKPEILGWNSINNERRSLTLRTNNTMRLAHPHHLHARNSNHSTAIAVNSTSETAAASSRRHRGLKRQAPPFCDDFKFEYAIDGKITSWDLAAFQNNSFKGQRVVELSRLDVPDASYRDGKEKEVQLAVRIDGCKHEKVFSLTHVYYN